MGLGDWYLRMLRYRAEVKANPDVIPAKNFLGQAYAESFFPNLDEGSIPIDKLNEVLPTVGRERKLLMNLLRNDQSFADGFAAMGDHLALVGDLHLAFLSYSRAIELDHPNTSEMKRRRRALLRHRESVEDKKFRGNSKRMAWWDAEVANAKKTIGKGAAWLKAFQRIEAALVKRKGDAVDFVDVEIAIETQQLTKLRP
ncbi:MAG: hypothetical protein ACI8XO_001137 [Verrucomicrobiales bacterium]|jgi:hypothetical protein